MSGLKNGLTLSHQYIEQFVSQGDMVIDATCGNGKDTRFLRRVVGKSGKVVAFDVQEIALTNTRNVLIKEGLYDNVTLVFDSHENMDQYVSNEVAGVMFNLGYLPQGNKSITTTGISTIEGIKKSLLLLKRNGIVTILIYYGMPSGLEEKKCVMDFCTNLPQEDYRVLFHHFMNQQNCPPILICIEKLS
jgi:predicted methyltransferase